jgi:hypothetical protein
MINKLAMFIIIEPKRVKNIRVHIAIHKEYMDLK